MTLSGALIATVPDDGEVIFLQASGGGRVTHTVSVFVDLRQGGIAKHIALLEPIGVWADQAFGPDGQLDAEGVAVAPERASDRIVEAIHAHRRMRASDPRGDVRRAAGARARAGRSARRSGCPRRLAQLAPAVSHNERVTVGAGGHGHGWP